MAHFYRPVKENNKRTRLLYATVLICIIFLLDLISGGKLRGLARVSAGFIHTAVGQASESMLETGLFSTRHHLASENARLQAALDEYKKQDALYAAEHDENVRLRALVGLSQKISGKAAMVTSSLTASMYGTFTIDRGSKDGVTRGVAVYTADGYAIGMVAEVNDHASLVHELFAPNATVEAVIGDTRVVLEGQGGGNARAHAPRESKIQIGDVARAPNVSAPVGIVEHIDAESTGADQVLYVRIPSNLEHLLIVYVAGK
jgi:rod shape-determining protein MreC